MHKSALFPPPSAIRHAGGPHSGGRVARRHGERHHNSRQIHHHARVRAALDYMLGFRIKFNTSWMRACAWDDISAAADFCGVFRSPAEYFAPAAAGNLSPGSAVLYCLRRHNLYCRCVMRREIVVYTARAPGLLFYAHGKLNIRFISTCLIFGTGKAFWFGVLILKNNVRNAQFLLHQTYPPLYLFHQV
jgi:hypothetical protein